MSIDYASEKLTAAVMSLATSASPIQKRLWNAAMACHTLSNPAHGDQDFSSHELRDRFHKWWAAMTAREPSGEEGSLEATIRQLSDEEAERLAEDLFEIYVEVEAAYVLAHAGR